MKYGKVRGFVWVDWLIVVALLLGGGAVAWRIRHSMRSSEATQPIVYTLEFTVDADFSWEPILPIGGAVTSANGTARLGEIVSVEKRPMRTAVVRDGRIFFAELPDRTRLLVTVRADAVAREGDGLRVGDIRIAADGLGDFRVGGYLAEGARVLSVQKEGI